MNKRKVSFEQIAAGALLKFGKLESADITLICKELSRYVQIDLNDESTDKYFIMNDGSILLNLKYVYKFYGKMYDSLIELVEGSVVEKYFTNLNISEFVLKKIKMLGLGLVLPDSLKDTFSKRQIEDIEELYNRGFIEYYMHEDLTYGDYEAIRVTKRGDIALFYAKNKKNINTFIKILREVGYEDEFINRYLLSQDLNLSCDEILSVDNFTLFCEKYVNGFEDNSINDVLKIKRK